MRATLLTISFLTVVACGDDHTDKTTPDTRVADSGVLRHDVRASTDVAAAPDTSFPGDAALPQGCTSPGLSPGTQRIVLQHGGLERAYQLHVPTGYTNTEPVPLVLNFHGFGSDPVQQIFFSGMNATADKAGFVVAYPAGINRSWNAGACCGDAAKTGIDDVGFARAVVADLQQKLCIDSKRVYATGMSNGGMLSHRLACEASDLFAAIGPVAGGLVLLLPPCTPSRPVPVVHFHGTLDTVVQYSSAVSSVDWWVAKNGCTDPSPTQTYSKGVASCEAYTQCSGGAEVVFCTITGGGHCWPGQPFCPLGLGTTDISANETIWELFTRHSLP